MQSELQQLSQSDTITSTRNSNCHKLTDSVLSYMNLYSILSSAHLSAFIIDLQGQILFWNVYMQKVTGYTTENVLAQNIMEITGTEASQLKKWSSIANTDTGSVQTVLFRFCRCTDRKYSRICSCASLNVSLLPLLDPNSQRLVGFCGIKLEASISLESDSSNAHCECATADTERNKECNTHIWNPKTMHPIILKAAEFADKSISHPSHSHCNTRLLQKVEKLQQTLADNVELFVRMRTHCEEHHDSLTSLAFECKCDEKSLLSDRTNSQTYDRMHLDRLLDALLVCVECGNDLQSTVKNVIDGQVDEIMQRIEPTEQWKLRGLLCDSEPHLESSDIALHSIHTFAFICNQSHQIVDWNRQAEISSGYTKVEAQSGDALRHIIESEDWDALQSSLTRAMDDMDSSLIKVTCNTKFGERHRFILSILPISDPVVNATRALAIGYLVDGAREIDYLRYLPHAEIPMFAIGTDHRVNRWNASMAKLIKHSSEEIKDTQNILALLSADDRKKLETAIHSGLTGEPTCDLTLCVLAQSNDEVHLSFDIKPQFDHKKRVSGVLGICRDVTDRIRQEAYERLIHTANALIIGVDCRGYINIWNAKAADMTQFSRTKVLGTLLISCIPEAYHAPLTQAFASILQGEEVSNFELYIITQSKNPIKVLLYMTARYDHNSRVVGIIAVGQDITDRIAQEQEYSRLIDTANAPIFGVDANMCVNIWNKKAAQITNYSIPEVIGENLVETFISPEYRPIVSKVFSEALHGSQTANFEFPLITRPGKRVEILLNATPRMDISGKIVGVVGIGQDITDRIAQENEYYRLIDTANAPIFGIDRNGNINEWNQKIVVITGYSKASVLGVPLVDTFVIPDSRQQVQQLIQQALVGVDVDEMELPMITKQGANLLLLVNASSKKDMHGNICGAIAVGQDHTLRKQMEAAKVNFLASFSHELRTPLNSVLGMLELLKDTKSLDANSERHVHMAYVSGSLLLNLINDILDLSKIESGHMEIGAAPFHLSELLEYSIGIFKYKAKEHDILLELSCGIDVPRMVIGDVVRLRQILLNLLSNAIKFTSKGTITVTCNVVEDENLLPQFKRLLFQVMDTGVGINVEDRARLFSLFTKLERTRSKNPTGSGLGLAICRQLVELMDGAIDVESEMNHGSNFYFTVVVRLMDEDQLLLHDNEVECVSSQRFKTLLQDKEESLSNTFEYNPTTISSTDAALDALHAPPSQARILVVEDNEFNWEVVKCYLQEDDHLLQWEVNGRRAVETYAEFHENFDILFMDCEMPIMDGYTATRLIRKFEVEHQLPRIPILGLTAYAMSGDRQKCVEAGMDEFIVKPISKSTLKKAIRHWMRKRYGKCPSQDAISASCNSNASYASQRSGTLESVKGNVVAFSPRMRERRKTSLSVAPSPKYPVSAHVALCDGNKLYRRTEHSSSQRVSLNLVPASRHMQQLDLANSISNLELDDPMATNMSQKTAHFFRNGAPVNSIFSSGSSAGNTTCSLRSVLNMHYGATPWKQRRDSIFSASFPANFHEVEESAEEVATQSRPKAKLFDRARPKISEQSSLDVRENPTLWSHPPAQIKAKVRKKMKRKEFKAFKQTMKDDSSLLVSERPSDDSIGLLSDSTITNHTHPMEICIPEGDPINFALGVEQCGGHEDLFLSLLEKFAKSCDQIMERITCAYIKKDLLIMRRESHSLKGSSAYVAAMRISKVAFRLQMSCERAMHRHDSELEGSDAVQLIRDTYELLQHEHRILGGYMKRNFAFTKYMNREAQEEMVTDSKAVSACTLM